MIRRLRDTDIDTAIQIWLHANLQAHCFIADEYWVSNYDAVEKAMSEAEVYVFEDNATKKIEGFIGLTDNFIEGIFVRKESRSKGIGKKLIDYIKGIRTDLRLNVYIKNGRAVHFYQREHFTIQSANIDENTNEKELTMIWSK